MNYRLEFRPEVAHDLREAIAWLHENDSGLGKRLRATLKNTLSRVLDHPLMYPPDHDGLRLVLLRPFQYHVGYIVVEHAIKVVGVYHAHRHPAVWTTRLTQEDE